MIPFAKLTLLLLNFGILGFLLILIADHCSARYNVYSWSFFFQVISAVWLILRGMFWLLTVVSITTWDSITFFMLYWLPNPLQFGAFFLLPLFFGQILYPNNWKENWSFWRIIYVGVILSLTVFQIMWSIMSSYENRVDCASSSDFSSCLHTEQVSDVFRLISSICFLVLSCCQVAFSLQIYHCKSDSYYRYIRISKNMLTFFNILMFISFSSRALYQIVAVLDLAFLPDIPLQGTSDVPLCVFFSFFLWDYVPTVLIISTLIPDGLQYVSRCFSGSCFSSFLSLFLVSSWRKKKKNSRRMSSSHVSYGSNMEGVRYGELTTLDDSRSIPIHWSEYANDGTLPLERMDSWNSVTSSYKSQTQNYYQSSGIVYDDNNNNNNDLAMQENDSKKHGNESWSLFNLWKSSENSSSKIKLNHKSDQDDQDDIQDQFDPCSLDRFVPIALSSLPSDSVSYLNPITLPSSPSSASYYSATSSPPMSTTTTLNSTSQGLPTQCSNSSSQTLHSHVLSPSMASTSNLPVPNSNDSNNNNNNNNTTTSMNAFSPKNSNSRWDIPLRKRGQSWDVTKSSNSSQFQGHPLPYPLYHSSNNFHQPQSMTSKNASNSLRSFHSPSSPTIASSSMTNCSTLGLKSGESKFPFPPIEDVSQISHLQVQLSLPHTLSNSKTVLNASNAFKMQDSYPDGPNLPRRDVNGNHLGLLQQESSPLLPSIEMSPQNINIDRMSIISDRSTTTTTSMINNNNINLNSNSNSHSNSHSNTSFSPMFPTCNSSPLVSNSSTTSTSTSISTSTSVFTPSRSTLQSEDPSRSESQDSWKVGSGILNHSGELSRHLIEQSILQARTSRHPPFPMTGSTTPGSSISHSEVSGDGGGIMDPTTLSSNYAIASTSSNHSSPRRVISTPSSISSSLNRGSTTHTSHGYNSHVSMEPRNSKLVGSMAATSSTATGTVVPSSLLLGSEATEATGASTTTNSTLTTPAITTTSLSSVVSDYSNEVRSDMMAPVNTNNQEKIFSEIPFIDEDLDDLLL